MCEGKSNRLPLSRPHLGTWPATQAHALNGNRTGNLWVCRSVLSPLSHTSQGCFIINCKDFSEVYRRVNKPLVYM